MQFKVNSNNQSRNPIFATNNIRECQQVEETWQRRVKYLRKHNQAPSASSNKQNISTK